MLEMKAALLLVSAVVIVSKIATQDHTTLVLVERNAKPSDR